MRLCFFPIIYNTWRFKYYYANDSHNELKYDIFYGVQFFNCVSILFFNYKYIFSVLSISKYIIAFFLFERTQQHHTFLNIFSKLLCKPCAYVRLVQSRKGIFGNSNRELWNLAQISIKVSRLTEKNLPFLRNARHLGFYMCCYGFFFSYY